jgi:hypothetical protein
VVGHIARWIFSDTGRPKELVGRLEQARVDIEEVGKEGKWYVGDRVKTELHV